MKTRARSTIPADHLPKRWTPSKIARYVFGSQLRRNMLSGNLASVVSASANLISYPIYLHFLGYKGLGVWLALSIIIAAAQVGNLGVPNAVAKIVAERKGIGDTQGVRVCLTNALAIVGIVGLIGVIGVFFARDHVVAALGLGAEHKQLARNLVPYVGALSAYVMWVDSFNATLVGLGRMDISSFSQAGTQVIGMTASAILLAAGHGPSSLLCGTAAGYLTLNIITVISVRRVLNMPVLDIRSIGFLNASRILQIGGWLFGSAAVSLLLSPLNKLMLARYVGVGALPVYEIAYTGAMRTRSFFESGLRALMPEVSAAAGGGPEKRMATDRKVTRTFHLTFWSGLLVYGILALVARPLLQLWLGRNLKPELISAFRMMLVATFANLLGVPAFFKLLGSGRVQICFLSSALLASVNVICLFAFVWCTNTVSIMNTCWGVLASMSAATAYLLWHGRPKATRLGY